MSQSFMTASELPGSEEVPGSERYLSTFCSSRDLGSISSTHMIAHNPPTLVRGFSHLLLASTSTDAQSSTQT